MSKAVALARTTALHPVDVARAIVVLACAAALILAGQPVMGLVRLF